MGQWSKMILHCLRIYYYLLFIVIVIQKRFYSSGNPIDYFAKTFEEYKRGFGANGELWLGLDKMHQLTMTGIWSLEVHLTDWNGNKEIARYSNFRVGPGPRYSASLLIACNLMLNIHYKLYALFFSRTQAQSPWEAATSYIILQTFHLMRF